MSAIKPINAITVKSTSQFYLGGWLVAAWRSNVGQSGVGSLQRFDEQHLNWTLRRRPLKTWLLFQDGGEGGATIVWIAGSFSAA